jgi:hypothetical protein
MTSQFQSALQLYNTNVNLGNTELKRIVTEDLPMETGFAYKVKTYPMPTIEQATKAKEKITGLRDYLDKERSRVQKIRDEEVKIKIEELGALIGMKDYTGKTPKEAKWIKEVKNQSFVNLTTSNFWRDSYAALTVIEKWITEKTKAEAEKKSEEAINYHANWCRQHLLSKGVISTWMANSISNETAIDLCHKHMKFEYEKANDITGAKCYCDSHDGARHSHFAETYWDGKEVTVYESSETY